MSNSVHARLGISVQEVRKQDPTERVNNWEEVYQGFDLERAQLEAARCIHCPSQPCVEVCPVHNDIPTALGLLEQGDVLGAAAVFRKTSTLPEMCGRLCPQERLCEGDCPVGFAIRIDGREEPPVRIGKLEAFVADQDRMRRGGFPLEEPPVPSGLRVAIVGSGPSGLTVAEELAKRGHEVVVYEQWPEPGGALAHGIPNFKLARTILQDKIRHLTLLGVDFHTNSRIGRDTTVDELFRAGFSAVYLGTGAGVDESLDIPGEVEFTGVVAATDFLVRANASAGLLLPAPGGVRAEPGSITARSGPRVVVIGGSDAATDCVRAALRLGASSVTLVYEADMATLESRREELAHAREEGVQFRFGARPLRFEGDERGRVTGVRCARSAWARAQEGAAWRDRHDEGSFLIPCDLAVVARGYVPDPFIRETTPGLLTDREHRLIVNDQTGETTRPGVFAGGDGVHGADLVVTAIAAGKRAAAAIHDYLQGLPPGGKPVAQLARVPEKQSATEKKGGWFRRRS